MIKYLEFDAFDEYGQHIIPINNDEPLTKIASNYSPELMKVILNMKRMPERYYVVINALGSYEYWGSNRNGDAFPEAGLAHKSYRTDMGTTNDYGYKTFEYYAKFFQHHANKPSSPSFGEVMFSHWNPVIHRVELIVAIDRFKAKDIVDLLEKGELVAVSMGCLTNPDYPILTIDGYKPIKDIKVNDLVFTHNGNWKKVTEIHRRKYTGKVCTLEMKGLPLPLELTSDHPMMLKSFKKSSNELRRAYVNPEEFEAKQFEWIHAGCAESGDHVKYLPVSYSHYEYAAIDDIQLSRLMGYYVAEGSFVYNSGTPCTIQLTCHIDDEISRLVPKIINELFPGTTCSVKPHRNNNKGLVVEIHSTKIAAFFNNYFGKHAHGKFIPPEMFVSSIENKLSFLGAWLSGGGWCDEKEVHWSSCNINLVLQARDLLISCGIPSSIYKINHKAGVGFSVNDTVEYTLNISHLDAEPLIPYSERKLSTLKNRIDLRIKDGNSAIRINNDGSYSYSIKDIQTRDVKNITTYNFEVESDESYLAAGLVSHNCRVRYDRCSICDNKAKTREQYCIHLKNYLGQIIDKDLADKWSRETGKIIRPGQQVFAWNDFPRFFDISRVYIGADRTAFVLGKAASRGHITSSVAVAEVIGIKDSDFDKIAQVKKEGDIDKEVGALGSNDIDGRVVPSEEANAFKKAINEKVQQARINENLLPNELLNSISSTLPLSSILSTMLGLGIHPKPQEFQRIVLIRIGAKPLADNLEDNEIIFDPEDAKDIDNINISNNNFSDTLGKTLAEYLDNRSSFPIFLTKRASLVKKSNTDLFGRPIIEKQETPVTPVSIFGPQVSTKPNYLIPILTGLAALYAGLKMTAMGYGPKQLAEIFINKPWLRNLIGGSVVYKIYDEIGKQNTPSILTAPPEMFENILQNTNFSGHMVKSSSIMENAEKIIVNNALLSTIALPAAYTIHHYNDKRMKKGKEGIKSLKDLPPPALAALTGSVGATGIYSGSKAIEALKHLKK